MSSIVLLLARPHALRHDWVRKELDACDAHERRLIVINIDNAAADETIDPAIRRRIKDRLYLNEPSPHPAEPSNIIVDQILQSFDAVRQDTRRVRAFVAASAVLAGLLLVSIAALGLVYAGKIQLERQQRLTTQNFARSVAREAEVIRTASLDALPISAIVAFESAERFRTTVADQEIRRVLDIAPALRESVDLPDFIHGVAFDPTGERVAITTGESIWLWERAGGSQGLRLLAKVRIPSTRHLGFTPDGKFIVHLSHHLGLDPFAVEISTGAVLDPPAMLARGIALTSHALDPQWDDEGKRHVTIGSPLNSQIGNPGGIVRVTETNVISSPLPSVSFPHEDLVSDAVLDPKGGLLATDGQFRGTVLWDVRTGKRITTLGEVTKTLAFSEDSRLLVTSGYLSAHVWDVHTKKELVRVVDDKNGIASAALSGDGHLLATASGTSSGTRKVVRIWDARPMDALTIPHDGWVSDLAVIPGTDLLATASLKTVLISKASDGSEVRRLNQSDDVNALAASPDGRLLAMGGDARITEIFEVGHREKPVMVIPQEETVSDVAFSADSRFVATAGGRWYHNLLATFRGNAPAPVTVHLRSLAQPGEDRALHHEQSVTAVRFSPRGDRLATSSEDGHARIWKLNDLASLADQRPVDLQHGMFMGDLAFAAGGSEIVTIAQTGPDESGSVSVWDVDRETRLFSVDQRVAGSRLAVSPDGRVVAAAGRPVLIIDLETQKHLELRDDDAAPYEAEHLAFSSDGRFLATGHCMVRDPTARIWAVDTGEEIARVSHQGRLDPESTPNQLHFVGAVGFAGAGDSLLVTTSQDTRARLWKWKLNDLEGELRSRLIRDLTDQEWQQYFGDEPPRHHFGPSAKQ